MRTLLFLICAALISPVFGHPDGPGVCKVDANFAATVTSGMGATNSETGWSITPSTATWTPGTTLTVQITHTSKTSYTGFILYAADTNGNSVGTWGTGFADTKLGSSYCTSGVGSNSDPGFLAHSTANPKPTANLYVWTPPASGYTDKVQFIGAVMTAGLTFQAFTTNTDVTYTASTGSPAPTSAAAATTAATTVATTKTGNGNTLSVQLHTTLTCIIITLLAAFLKPRD